MKLELKRKRHRRYQTQGRNHWGGQGVRTPPTKNGLTPNFSHDPQPLPHPSFENPGAATATVPTPSSTLAPSVAQPSTFSAWLRPWHFNNTRSHHRLPSTHDRASASARSPARVRTMPRYLKLQTTSWFGSWWRRRKVKNGSCSSFISCDTTSPPHLSRRHLHNVTICIVAFRLLWQAILLSQFQSYHAGLHLSIVFRLGTGSEFSEQWTSKCQQLTTKRSNKWKVHANSERVCRGSYMRVMQPMPFQDAIMELNTCSKFWNYYHQIAKTCRLCCMPRRLCIYRLEGFVQNISENVIILVKNIWGRLSGYFEW